MSFKELLLNHFTERETDFLISRIANMIYNYREDFGKRSIGSKTLLKLDKLLYEKK